MTKLIIDSERGHRDYKQQIMDMETSELLALAEAMANNPTPFQVIVNELQFRKNHEKELEHTEQKAEITELLG